jgi:integrase
LSHGGELAANPTLGLELPKVTGRRDRVAAPDEAARLLAALPQTERALWATALFAGLRLGELQALSWENVERGKGLIHVVRAFDEKSRVFVAPKSRAGARKVPIVAELRDQLLTHKARTRDSGLVFGRAETLPFSTSTTDRRAKRAWAKAELAPIGLHECRHTFASILIAAGVNAKALSTYLGHSSIQITRQVRPPDARQRGRGRHARR